MKTKSVWTVAMMLAGALLLAGGGVAYAGNGDGAPDPTPSDELVTLTGEVCENPFGDNGVVISDFNDMLSNEDLRSFVDLIMLMTSSAPPPSVECSCDCTSRQFSSPNYPTGTISLRGPGGVGGPVLYPPDNPVIVAIGGSVSFSFESHPTPTISNPGSWTLLDTTNHVDTFTWTPDDTPNSPHKSKQYDTAGNYGMSCRREYGYTIEYQTTQTCTTCGIGQRTLNQSVPLTTSGSASRNVTVVEVKSVVPAGGTEVDDGISGTNRKAYILARSTATDKVTVTATPYPSVAEDKLPSWSYIGGDVPAGGTGKLSREFAKNVAAIHTFKVTCGTSEQTVVVYVVGADIRDGGPEGALVSDQTNGDQPVADMIGVRHNLGVYIVPSGMPPSFRLEPIYRWTIPDKAIREWNANNSRGEVIYLEDYNLKNESISFAWTTIGTKQLNFGCFVKGIAITSSATFNVQKPAIQFRHDVGWTILTQPGIYLPQHKNSYGRMALGDYDGIPAYGCDIFVQVTWPTGFTGDISWVQLMMGYEYFESEGSVNGGHYNHDVTNWTLDLAYPTPYRTTKFYDTPSQPLSNRGLLYGTPIFAKVSQQFRAYLLITPADGIPVPVAYFPWQWKAGAQKKSATGVWQLLNYTSNSKGSPVSYPDYPTWSTRYQDSSYSSVTGEPQ